MAATFTQDGDFRSAARYAAKLSKRPSCGASIRFSGMGSAMPSRSGAALMPQLPVMTVVTPCEILKGMAG